MMDHEQIQGLLPGYLDGELSLTESLAVERHLGNCPACRSQLEAESRASRLLRQAGLRAELPEHLEHRIRAALPAQQIPRIAPIGWWRGRLANFALAAGMAAMAFGTGWYFAEQPDGDASARLPQAVVDSHIRSLQLDHLADVRSTDRHTVKPWFDGKLDFAPSVSDFAQQGYPLIGGRLDYLDGKLAAVMVYRYQQHPINLYTWPDRGADTAPRAGTRQGYHYASWRAADMAYWAITDTGQPELDRFIALLRGSTPPPNPGRE
jgi:anti-sigma factor RsiW